MKSVKKMMKYIYHNLKRLRLIRIRKYIYKLNKQQGFANDKIKDSILILEPAETSKGNLGDEALILGSIAAIKRRNKDANITILHYPSNDGMLNQDVNYLNMPSSLKDVAFIKNFAKYEQLYILGADIMDGHYSNYSVIFPIELCKIAHELNIKPSIISFSFNSNPTEYAKKIFKNLPSYIRLSCRDEISLERLKNITTHKIECYPDIAFCVPSTRDDGIVNNLMNTMKRKDGYEENKKMILLNINPLPFQKLNKMDEFYNIFEQTINKLVEDGYFVTCVPHVFRSGDSDLEAQNVIYKSLDSNIQNSVFLVNEELHCDQIKELLTYYDLVVTGRMHLSIGSYGMGKACAIIGYQGKCEGFIKWFDLPKSCLIDFSEALSDSKLLNFIEDNYNNSNNLEELAKSKYKIIIDSSSNHINI